MKHSFATKSTLALVLFGVLGLLLVVLVPFLFHTEGAEVPPLSLYLTVGTGLTILLSLLVYFVGNVSSQFGHRASLLFTGYLSLIALVKFTFAPANAYRLNQQSSFEQGGFLGISEYNNPSEYLLIGLVIFAAYAVVLFLIYRAFLYSTRNALKATEPAEPRKSHKGRWTLIALIALSIVLSGGAVLIVPLIPLIIAGPYLGIAVGGGVATALVFAFGFAVFAFKEASDQAILVRDAGIVASLFVVSLLFLAALHILWFVYFAALIALWPFNVTTVSSK